MSRYKVVSEWSMDSTYPEGIEVQSATIEDTKNGQQYREGAFRVLRNGKPVKTGKGGTVPFYGESAWSAAERLAMDTWFAVRFS